LSNWLWRRHSGAEKHRTYKGTRETNRKASAIEAAGREEVSAAINICHNKKRNATQSERGGGVSEKEWPRA